METPAPHTPVLLKVETPKDRLDRFLSRATGESRSFIKGQILSARVLVNGNPTADPSHTVRESDTVSVSFKERVGREIEPIEAPLDILFEDETFLVLNKPQGVVVHPAPGHQGETLVHHLLHHLQNAPSFTELSPSRPGIVHRLDRGTSGILCVAKTRHALEALCLQFKERRVKKQYEALVWGKMKALSGTFSTVVGRDSRDRKKMSSRTAQGRDALTHWKIVRAYPHFALLELTPHTGRTHQLRVHLCEAGHSVVGDDLYGRGAHPRRLAALPEALQGPTAEITQTFLHARSLTCFHPGTGEPMVFTAPRPVLFQNFLDLLETGDT